MANLLYKIHRETQALPFVFQIYIQDDEEGKNTCVVVSPKIYQLFAAPAEIEATGKKEFLTESAFFSLKSYTLYMYTVQYSTVQYSTVQHKYVYAGKATF